MIVIAEEPWGWFLFADGDVLYLNVLVEHGAVSFDVTAALTDEQGADFARRGAASLTALASEMRRQAIMHEWQAPSLPANWSERSMAAVDTWRDRRPTTPAFIYCPGDGQ